MEELNMFINGDEVISIINKEDNVLIEHNTYKASDFIDQLGENLNYDKGKKWLSEGVETEILAPNQTWQKGKIKICLQFIPDRPESVLDDIRQENQ